MKHLTRLCRTAVAAAIVASLPWAAPAFAAPRADQPVAQHTASPDERYEISNRLAARFGAPDASDMRIATAGTYRFIHAPEYLYFERADTGSVGLELPQYGTSPAGLDATALDKDTVLGRVEVALLRAGLRAEGRHFDTFYDEFAGAALPESLPPGFDPKAASTHMARTTVYKRTLNGVPVFGSELLVGLMPDGTIGRLRLHWPELDARLAADAVALQRAVRSQQWALPDSVTGPETTILETSTGIVHSGFADPGMRAQAVVRVMYRKQSPDTELPLSSTGYKYFDANGNEVVVSSFPQLPGTAAGAKPKTTR